jgi:hypothetical protein
MGGMKRFYDIESSIQHIREEYNQWWDDFEEACSNGIKDGMFELTKQCTSLSLTEKGHKYNVAVLFLTTMHEYQCAIDDGRELPLELIKENEVEFHESGGDEGKLDEMITQGVADGVFELTEGLGTFPHTTGHKGKCLKFTKKGIQYNGIMSSMF